GMDGKKKMWSWDQYLEEQKAIAAPVKLFTEQQSFPHCRNGFKVGMRLEGIDPLHPSMFCVLSVAEVIGYRLRLHFDGFSDCYDFWVNADSPDIRPAGWCETTGRRLHPPKGCKEDDFNWSKYLEACNAQAAPKNLFKNQNTTVTPSQFEAGMKLEAVDRKNPCLVCVATVADVVDHRFLVHFDNWDDTYDYWCDSSSPHIHPVGWCQDNGRPLTAPQGYPNPENFKWEEYLEDTGSSAVPSKAFNVKPPHKFRVNMKLEAVDKRNPMLIRVATIIDTEDYKIKVHFDGWHHKFDFWADSDSTDIHPVGWCARTGHPLEMPLKKLFWFVSGPADLKISTTQGVCPTPGCRGVGHIKGARYTGHHSFGPLPVLSTILDCVGLPVSAFTSLPALFLCCLSGLTPSAFGCPYSEINMKKEVTLQDRLGGEKQITFVPVRFVAKAKSLYTADEHEQTDECNMESRQSETFNFGYHVSEGPLLTQESTGKRNGPRAEPSRMPGCESSGRLRGRYSSHSGSPLVKREHSNDPPAQGNKPLTPAVKKAKLQSRLAQSTKYLKMKEEEEDIDLHSLLTDCGSDSMQQALHQSVFLSAMSAHPSRDLPLCWEQHCKLLPGVAGVQASQVLHWTADEVASFVHSLPGCEEPAKQFKDEQIDGEAFLLMTQTDIVKIMNIKLGPALKIYNSILMFQYAEEKTSGNNELNT
ncbi:LMBL4 protein, partial [Atractosteus spatula]|nr:LMBL4 protein [Atractosteus spatula]